MNDYPDFDCRFTVDGNLVSLRHFRMLARTETENSVTAEVIGRRVSRFNVQELVFAKPVSSVTLPVMISKLCLTARTA